MNISIKLGACSLAAALVLSATNLFAQPGGGGPGGPGGPGGFGPGGGGPGGPGGPGGGGFGGGPGGGGPGGGGFGGGPGGGGGFGGGNFDPAQFQQQMQQYMLDNYRQNLEVTNDTDWNAIMPLVQKVMTAQQAANTGGGMGGMGGFGGRGGGGGFGGFGAQASDEETALQTALDNSAPTAQIKDALTKLRAARKVKQDALHDAQEKLRAVLSSKQEARAVLLGLLT